MKKRRGLILVIALILAFGTGVVAKNAFDVITAEVRTDFIVEIDGVKREFRNVNGDRVYPILHNGTTYLPLRAIGEIMDKDVYWFEDEKRIELRDKKSSTVTDADVIVDDNSVVDKPANIDEAEFIGKENAKQLALKKANLKESEVYFIKIELDKDDGVFIYDIEFRHGFKEYSAEIKADDGKILDWEVDIDD